MTGYTLRTPADAEERRQRLQRFVFGPSGLPGGRSTVERDVEDDDFTQGLANLQRIDRLTIELPLEFTSVAYHVIPQRPNGGLLVYHNGHN